MGAFDHCDGAKLVEFQRKANTLAFYCSPIMAGCTVSRRCLEMLKIVHDQKTELLGPHHYFF